MTTDLNRVVGYDDSTPDERLQRDEELAVEFTSPPQRAIRTSVSKQPLKKGWLFASVVMMGFSGLFAVYYLLTNRQAYATKPVPTEVEAAEIEQLYLQSETAGSESDNKTRMALGEQANDLVSFQELEEPAPEPEVEAPLPPVPVQPVAQVTPRPTPTPDPLQVWNQLQSVGSFGQVQVATSGSVSATIASSNQLSSTASASSRLSSLVASNRTAAADIPQSPAIDLRLERDFLNGGRSARAIAAGTTSEGTIEIPAIWSPYDEANGSTELFVIQLSSPLVDTAGVPVVPSGSELSVRIDRVEPTGYVRMSGVAIAKEVGGQKQQFPLPAGSVSVRGEGGDALLARNDPRLDPGGDIASMDAGLFALGGLGKVGELLNRADSVQTNSFSGFGGSSFSSSVDNGNTNIVGGILEGGANAILPSIQQRNQRAIQEAMQREQLWVVEAGTAVTVVVNREIQL